MKVLEILSCVIIFIHILDAATMECMYEEFLNKITGFTCYPCPPGFHVIEGCKTNGTTNTCVPCPDNTFQETCSTQASRCKSCGSCPYPRRQIITKNCTRTQDVICACKENYYWDTHHHICINTCPSGKKIVPGKEGEGLLCEPCEAGTFSNKNNSHKCEQCSRCSDYKIKCTQTSDAICNQITAVTNPSPTGDASTTACVCEPCEDYICGERIALIVVSVVFWLLIVCILVAYLSGWLKISGRGQSQDMDRTTRTHPSPETVPLRKGKGIEETEQKNTEPGDKGNTRHQGPHEGEVVSLEKQPEVVSLEKQPEVVSLEKQPKLDVPALNTGRKESVAENAL